MMTGIDDEWPEPGDEPGRSFPELMALVRAGDEAASAEVHRRWNGRLIRLAKTRLGRTVAGKEDPEDVVQSVYKSFFRRFSGGGYQVEAWADVWALLATIASRKCSNRRELYQAGRRDARREAPLPAGGDVAAAGSSGEQAAMLSETVDRLLAGFDGDDRKIVELSLQGYSVVEIAPKVERSERTVFRVRECARTRLESWNRCDEPRRASP